MCSKEYTIGICCFSAKNASLRRKIKDCLARNQNNVSEWSDISTQWLRGEYLKKSANQKQESPVATLFVHGSGRNEQSSQRTFHRCFLLSFGSFGQAVSEEKNLIFSIVFYFLLIFFTNFQVWEVATFDGSRGHHSWSERELYRNLLSKSIF
jgi:hypothetical protein